MFICDILSSVTTKIVRRICHQVNSLMAEELVCDEIAVVDNRSIFSISIHSHQWVWDSLHAAHTNCG